MMLGLAKSFLLSTTTRRLAERCGWSSELAEDKGMRESLTSITRSASLRRLRMARVAAAMWPGYQLIAPPPALNPISPKPFFNSPFSPSILIHRYRLSGSWSCCWLLKLWKLDSMSPMAQFRPVLWSSFNGLEVLNYGPALRVRCVLFSAYFISALANKIQFKFKIW